MHFPGIRRGTTRFAELSAERIDKGFRGCRVGDFGFFGRSLITFLLRGGSKTSLGNWGTDFHWAIVRPDRKIPRRIPVGGTDLGKE